MPLLFRPTAEFVEQFVASQSALDFTYPGVGGTASQPPPGYPVHRHRVLLGQGDEVFNIAKQALIQWRQFNLDWLQIWPRQTAIRQGQTVATVACYAGLWWLNACRIVYVIHQPQRRFGFAYGTLPQHSGKGEERFLIEQDEEGAVWYEVMAFSLPKRLLVRLGSPLLRRLQRRFREESALAMHETISEWDHSSPAAIAAHS